MSWTGFYIGLNGGGTWGTARVTHSPVFAAPGAFPIDAAAVTTASSPDLRLDGFTIGGHFGYNWQFSQNWLIGLEADVSYFRLRGSSNGTFPFPSTLPGGLLGPPTLTFTANTSFETDWLFTFRPRAGVIIGDSLLAYVTGGLAVTNEKVTQTTGILNASTFNSSIDATRLGWVFGGGLEYALGRNWTIRAEYLHLDFGTANGSGNLAAPAGISRMPSVRLAKRRSPVLAQSGDARSPRASPPRSFVPASPTGSMLARWSRGTDRQRHNQKSPGQPSGTFCI